MDMRGICGGNTTGDRCNPRIKGFATISRAQSISSRAFALNVFTNQGQRSLLEHEQSICDLKALLNVRFDSTVGEICIHFRVIYLGWSAERAVVSVWSSAFPSVRVCLSVNGDRFITIGRLSRNANESDASARDMSSAGR